MTEHVSHQYLEEAKRPSWARCVAHRLVPRFVHHWYANRIGYFWLPCPICGWHFGGHERGFGTPEQPDCIRQLDSFKTVHFGGDEPFSFYEMHTCICPWCTWAGKGNEYAVDDGGEVVRMALGQERYT